MKLISCHIENFGRLSDYSLSFAEGLNTICHENGWGKSTLAVFLRVMLYGFENEGKRSTEENERKRFRPWQKGTYGGTLTFEAGGRTYEVTEVFGSKASEDSFQIKDAQTHLGSEDFGRPVPGKGCLLQQADDARMTLGQALFRIDSASFMRTIYVPQLGCDTSVTSDISAKIGNLSDETADLGRYDAAKELLKKNLDAITEDRATGEIAKKKKQVADLRTLMLQETPLTESREQLEADLRELGRSREENLEAQEAVRALIAKENRRLIRAKEREEAKRLREEAKRVRAEAEAERAALLQERAEQENQRNQRQADREKRRLEWEKKRDALTGKRDYYESLLRARKEAERQVLELRDSFPHGIPSGEEYRRISMAASHLDVDASDARNAALGNADRAYLEELAKQFEEEVPGKEELAEVEELIGRRNALRAPVFLGGILLAAGGILVAAGILTLVLAPGSAAVGTVLAIAGAALLLISAWRLSAERQYRKKIAYLDGEIGRFFRHFGRVPEANRLTDALFTLRQDIRSYERLLEARQKEEEAQERLRKNRTEVEDFLERYVAGEEQTSASCEERFQEVQKKMQRLEMLQEKEKQCREDLYAFEERELPETMEELRHPERMEQMPAELLEEEPALPELLLPPPPELPAEEEEAPDAEASDAQDGEETNLPGPSMEELTQKEKELRGQAEELQERKNLLLSRLSKLEEDLAGIRDGARELEEGEAKLQELMAKRDVMQLTQEYLTRARESFSAHYMNPILAGFEKYYELLSPGDGKAYELDANLDLKLKEFGSEHSVEFLSAGYRDLVALCRRMAMTDAMYEEEKPFLILDDPFVNLDRGKLGGALDFLRALAQEHQLIYFTCHESRIPGAEGSAERI